MKELLSQDWFQDYLKDKYDFEHDRRKFLYTQIAIYMGIISFIFTIQIRFAEKFISGQNYPMVLFALWILSVLPLFLSLVFLGFALWPPTYMYLSPPSRFMNHAKDYYKILTTSFKLSHQDAGKVIIEVEKKNLTEDLIKASERNYKLNNIRSGHLARSSWFIAFAIFFSLLLAFIILIG